MLVLPSSVRAVLFDLDGTLFDTAIEIHEAALVMLTALELPPIALEQTHRLIGKGAQNFVERALVSVGASNVDVAKAFPLFLDAYYQTTGTIARPYPGVIEGLKAIAGLDLPMAIVTNKQAALAVKLLEAHTVSDYFSLILGGDQMLRKKPDPWSIHDTCLKLNCPIDQAIFVGDSDNDWEAAEAAGVHGIVMKYGYPGELRFDELSQDRVASHFTELVEALRAKISQL